MRRFEFPVDVAHAKSVNETFTELRRLRMSAALTAAVLLALGIWFFWIATPWSYILGGVFCIQRVLAGHGANRHRRFGRIRHFADFEDHYGGPFGTWRHWYDFMEEMKVLCPGIRRMPLLT